MFTFDRQQLQQLKQVDGYVLTDPHTDDLIAVGKGFDGIFANFMESDTDFEEQAYLEAEDAKRDQLAGK